MMAMPIMPHTTARLHERWYPTLGVLVRGYRASSSVVKLTDAELMSVFSPAISKQASIADHLGELEPVADYGLGSIGSQGRSANEVRAAGKQHTSADETNGDWRGFGSMDSAAIPAAAHEDDTITSFRISRRITELEGLRRAARRRAFV